MATVFERAGKVTAREGFVLVDGPGNIPCTLTPDAADAFGQSLSVASDAARRQQGNGDLDADEG